MSQQGTACGPGHAGALTAYRLVAPCRAVPRPAAGDVNGIKIGENTNIQDNVTIHVARHSLSGKITGTTIGDNVTIGGLLTLSGAPARDTCQR